jgi:hypothetical protein
MGKTSGGLKANGPFAGTTWTGCICHFGAHADCGEVMQVNTKIHDEKVTLYFRF